DPCQRPALPHGWDPARWLGTYGSAVWQLAVSPQSTQPGASVARPPGGTRSVGERWHRTAGEPGADHSGRHTRGPPGAGGSETARRADTTAHELCGSAGGLGVSATHA